MAFGDYGIIVNKNGVNVNKDLPLFSEMFDCVGFELKKPVIEISYYNGKKYENEIRVKDNYFYYIGDENLLFCFYKAMILVVSNGKFVKRIDGSYFKNKFTANFNFFGTEIKIKKISDDNKFIFETTIDENKYKIIYGYGIVNDYNIAKKLTKKQRYGYNDKTLKKIKKYY